MNLGRSLVVLGAGCGVVGVAGCGAGSTGGSVSFSALGSPRTLSLYASSYASGKPRRSSTAIAVGTLTLRGGPGDRGIEMNNEIGWGPSNPDESVAFCIAGGALGRRVLREQQTNPDRTFTAPSLEGADVHHECVFQTDSHVVPAGTYTVLLRVDAPSTPTSSSIYATGMLWGPNGHNAGKMLSHTIRRSDRKNFATVRVVARHQSGSR